MPKKFVGESLCVSEKVGYGKKLTHKKGISLFSAINFLSHRVQKFRRGTRLCFRKLRVLKNFMDKRRGACIPIFCQIFSLTKPKNFEGEPFCVSENFGFRKRFWIREEGCVSQFFVKVCVSQSRKTWYGKPSLFQKKTAFEKTFGQ